jgi:hypothetical protein
MSWQERRHNHTHIPTSPPHATHTQAFEHLVWTLSFSFCLKTKSIFSGRALGELWAPGLPPISVPAPWLRPGSQHPFTDEHLYAFIKQKGPRPSSDQGPRELWESSGGALGKLWESFGKALGGLWAPGLTPTRVQAPCLRPGSQPLWQNPGGALGEPWGSSGGVLGSSGPQTWLQPESQHPGRVLGELYI